MLTYPEISPIILHICGPFAIRWYGLMYVIGILCIWWLLKRRAQGIGSQGIEVGATKQYFIRDEQIKDFAFYVVVGLLIGGHLGYLLFYSPQLLISNPWLALKFLLKFWQFAGMSFHGGLLGAVIAVFWFAKKHNFSVLKLCDMLAPVAPIGLFFGRIGNFINGELWGRATDVPWAMVFPTADLLPRHPSQLYESLLEGLLLFVLLQWYNHKQTSKTPGKVTAFFLMGYAVARSFVEFYREPDMQYGYLAFDWLTMGQILSLPILIVGLLLWLVTSKKHRNKV